MRVSREIRVLLYNVIISIVFFFFDFLFFDMRKSRVFECVPSSTTTKKSCDGNGNDNDNTDYGRREQEKIKLILWNSIYTTVKIDWRRKKKSFMWYVYFSLFNLHWCSWYELSKFFFHYFLVGMVHNFFPLFFLYFERKKRQELRSAHCIW